MWILILFALVSHARDFNPEGPGPGRPPRCNRTALDRCRAENASARDAQLARIPGLARNRDSLARERADLGSASVDYERRIESLGENERLTEREAAFLEEALLPKDLHTLELPFPIEALFSLTPAERDWLETLPAERLSRLRRSHEALRSETAGTKAALASIFEKIHSVAAELSRAEQELSAALAAADAHGKMCESGCEMSHCPYAE